MANILYINDLYDNSFRQPFGFVGLDIETKDLKYLAFCDNNPSILQEFNPITVEPYSRLWYHMQNCDFMTESFDPNLPLELKKSISEALLCHQKFNKKNNFPTTFLEQNSKHLRVVYNSNIDMNDAAYDAIENLMELPVSRALWPTLLSNERTYIKSSSIIHELGHMKVSTWDISPSGKTVIFQSGFIEDFYELEKIETLSGDIIHKPIIMPGRDNFTPEDAVDEIINDYEGSLISLGYQASYPKLGRILNNLCDRKLLAARYNADFDFLVERLYAIDPNYLLIEELLKALDESIYSDNSSQAEKEARKILKYYQRKKAK